MDLAVEGWVEDVELHVSDSARLAVGHQVREEVDSGETGIGRVGERTVTAQVDRSVEWSRERTRCPHAVELDRIEIVGEHARRGDNERGLVFDLVLLARDFGWIV